MEAIFFRSKRCYLLFFALETQKLSQIGNFADALIYDDPSHLVFRKQELLISTVVAHTACKSLKTTFWRVFFPLEKYRNEVITLLPIIIYVITKFFTLHRFSTISNYKQLLFSVDNLNPKTLYCDCLRKPNILDGKSFYLKNIFYSGMYDCLIKFIKYRN